MKRCCGSDDVPSDLRSKVMMRIELIRSGQAVPETDDLTASGGASGGAGSASAVTASEAPSS